MPDKPRLFPPPAALVAADLPSRPAPAPMSTLKPNACGSATGAPQPTVIVADRWQFGRASITTWAQIEHRKRELRHQYGACELVFVQQDSPAPELQFRVPNPLVLVDGQCFAFPMDMACIDGSDDDAEERAA